VEQLISVVLRDKSEPYLKMPEFEGWFEFVRSAPRKCPGGSISSVFDHKFLAQQPDA
jgi:hypothetical protein